MKKALSLLICIVMLALSACMLFSCGGSEGQEIEVPEGMKLVRGGEDVGYYFFAPTEWTVASDGDFNTVYVSSINNTSVTFVEAPMPEGTIAEYFESEKDKMPAEITVTTNGEKCNLGNADSAYRYMFNYTYQEVEVRTMQIFATYGERFYILTYTYIPFYAVEGEDTYYTTYLERVEAIMESLKFVDKKGENGEKGEYVKDKDGYILISDRKLCGFDMYVPDAYTPNASSAIVSATRADGTHINISRVTMNLGLEKYWEQREKELKELADTVTDGEGKEKTSYTLIHMDDKASEVNSTLRCSMEYTYIYQGKAMHIYQVYIRTSGYDYMFTYSTTEELYATHIDEAKRVAAKVVF